MTAPKLARSRKPKPKPRRDRINPLREALSERPRTARELSRLTGLEYTTVCLALRQYPRFFVRTHPGAPVGPGCPATWRLVPYDNRPDATKCRHCCERHVNRPRGLCWGCYYTPSISKLYTSQSPYARRGVGNSPSRAPLPLQPTEAPPGSRDKMAVMHARALRGESLFHPEDCREVDRSQINPFHGTDYDGGEDNGLLPVRGVA